MGEANQNKNRSSSSSRAMESLSLEINRYPRDLLQRFMSTTTDTQHQYKATAGSEELEEDKEEIELNLGLSLGGRFGVDKTAVKKLTRSSSIAGSIPVMRESDDVFFNTQQQKQQQVAATYPVLMRTSSLPTETEEEWRKRKEMQCLRRMEAKRRRSEKQKNLSGVLRGGGELNLEEDKRELNVNRGNLVSSWTRQALNAKKQQQQQQGSQGSVDSQGGSSSGMSEMESRPLQGSSSGGEARSPPSNQPLHERNNQEAVGSSGTKANELLYRTSSRQDMENLAKKFDSSENRGREIGMNAMEDMPCVFTKVDGPNGRRVDGILYKYGRGEEVRIMCVCHGSFLSPAEFVKHAGGGDVDNPLRHIVVNPAGASFC